MPGLRTRGDDKTGDKPARVKASATSISGTSLLRRQSAVVMGVSFRVAQGRRNAIRPICRDGAKPPAGYRATFTDTRSRPCPTVEGAFMPNRNLTNTTRLKGRELLRRLRPRFPALFPAVRGALKP